MNIEIAQQKIKRIMKDNCFKRRVPSTGGRIEFNRLPFYKTSRVLFSRESELKGKKYSVELLLDVSGSMWNYGHIDLACHAVEQFAKSMGKYCDLSIVLFNYLEERVRWQDFTHGEYSNKSRYGYASEVVDVHGRRLIVPSQSRNNYPTINKDFESGAGNWEIINILNSAQRLRRKQGKRIMLVVLDGAPNLDEHMWEFPTNIHIAGHRVDKLPTEDYKKHIQKLSKDITVIGYGIHTNSPERFFPNFYQINDDHEILPTLIKSLQKFIV